jgi:hypothetical protein
MNITLKPFTVPNFVIQVLPVRPRQEGIGEPRSYPLSDVDADELSDMCDVFRVEVFRKAGKADPRKRTR